MYKKLVASLMIGVFTFACTIPGIVRAEGSPVETIQVKQQAFDKVWNDVLNLRGTEDYKLWAESENFAKTRAQEFELQKIAKELIEAEKNLELQKGERALTPEEKAVMSDYAKKAVLYDHYHNLPEENAYNDKNKMSSNAGLEKKYTVALDNLRQAEINRSLKEQAFEEAKAKKISDNPALETARAAELKKAEKEYKAAEKRANNIRMNTSNYKTPKQIYDPITLKNVQTSSSALLQHFENPIYKEQLKRMVGTGEYGANKNTSTSHLLGGKMSSGTRQQQMEYYKKSTKFGNYAMSKNAKSTFKNEMKWGAIMGGASVGAFMLTSMILNN